MSAKLAAKMVLAMKEIDAVLKHGRNEFQKYNYVRAADVANEVRKAIIAHGIAFTYDVVDVQHWEATKEGKSTNYFCQLTVNATFTDTESGEQLSGKVVGWGTDTLDKAPYKAMTGALKYALRMNFLIPDESDPENDREEHEAAKNKTLVEVVIPKYITSEQATAFRDACLATGYSPEAIKKALADAGIKSSARIPQPEYRQWMEWAQATAEVPA